MAHSSVGLDLGEDTMKGLEFTAQLTSNGVKKVQALAVIILAQVHREVSDPATANQELKRSLARDREQSF